MRVGPEAAPTCSRLHFELFEHPVSRRIASVPPRQTRPNQLQVEVAPVGEDHVGDDAAVLIPIGGLHPDHFPEGQIRGELLRPGAVGLALLRASLPGGRMRVWVWSRRTVSVSPSATLTTRPSNNPPSRRAA